MGQHGLYGRDATQLQVIGGELVYGKPLNKPSFHVIYRTVNRTIDFSTAKNMVDEL